MQLETPSMQQHHSKSTAPQTLYPCFRDTPPSEGIQSPLTWIQEHPCRLGHRLTSHSVLFLEVYRSQNRAPRDKTSGTAPWDTTEETEPGSAGRNRFLQRQLSGIRKSCRPPLCYSTECTVQSPQG